MMNQQDKQKLLALRQQNIGRMFQRAARAYSELALEKLSAKGHEGLTLFHTNLISNLDVEGTHIKVLAERAGMSKQAMGQVANELEKRGYVKAVTDSKDKRATLITFTNLGWTFLEDAYEAKLAIERTYTAKLGSAK
ncbi:MAG: MarR family winged helix-turn-helix transcriptional regulator [Trueperaceae bacterium]